MGEIVLDYIVITAKDLLETIAKFEIMPEQIKAMVLNFTEADKKST